LAQPGQLAGALRERLAAVALGAYERFLDDVGERRHESATTQWGALETARRVGA
jgi:hypothetical protein